MPEDAAVAIGYLEEALELYPDYAAAHALLAACLETRFRRAGFDEANRSEGVRHARSTLALGTDDASVSPFRRHTEWALARPLDLSAVELGERPIRPCPARAAFAFLETGEIVHSNSFVIPATGSSQMLIATMVPSTNASGRIVTQA